FNRQTHFMLAIIRANAYFFLGLLLFTIAGGLLLWQTEHGAVIWYFSARRTMFGDLFFRYFTKVGEINSYLLLTIAFLFYRYRYAFLVPLTGFLTLGVSLAAKTYFGHPRPVVYFKTYGVFDQLNTVEGVALFGSASFPSGHTMSAFALFGLLAMISPRKKTVGLLLFIIALLIGISRVYLIQHFFEDIYAGALAGTSLALLIYYVQSFLSDRPELWYNQSLRTWKSAPWRKMNQA
ncbi:MAG: phosphatase PAP2 family protein, partial [Bacteroidota bacterium]